VRDALTLVRLVASPTGGPPALGGQQQRVALARALVIRPRVLLLDEPLAALDRKLRQEMRAELKEIQRAVGTTTVFVTHDQHEALGLSDRVAVMNHGRIEQLGTPEEVYERPVTAFVATSSGPRACSRDARRRPPGRDLRRAYRRPADRPLRAGEMVRLVIRPSTSRSVLPAPTRCPHRSPVSCTSATTRRSGSSWRAARGFWPACVAAGGVDRGPGVRAPAGGRVSGGALKWRGAG